VPPRYAYWTILIDNAPTAFRARDREELQPTVTQLRRTNKNVDVRWFARGRLWDSPEQAQWAAKNPLTEKRGRDWRPGGNHQDPRARFDKRSSKPPKRKPFSTTGDTRRSDSSRPAFNRPPASGRRPAGGSRPRDTRPKSWSRDQRPPSADRFRDRPRSDKRPQPRGPDSVPPHKRDQSPDQPPAAEQIVTKPKPPERG
jgi:hypothetical protein